MIKPDKTWRDLKSHYLRAIESEWYKVIVNLQNTISYATTDFYRNRKIKTLFLPVTTGSISSPMGLGSDSTPVSINLCGIQTYLADSMQFLLEYGCRLNIQGCYYLMPSFRGEESDERHLCQFYHSEAEIPGDINSVIELVEKYLKYLCSIILQDCGNDIIKVTGSLDNIIKLITLEEIPRISYSDAISLLSANSGCLRTDSNNFTYITSLGEKELVRQYGGYVWLTYMDSRIVPFYQACDKNTGYSKCADLLFGIGEVVGCGERHVTGEEVRAALLDHKVPENEYKWYIEMKDKYPMLTSGFGMGTERFIAWVLDHNDIRDCQLVPRINGVDVLP